MPGTHTFALKEFGDFLWSREINGWVGMLKKGSKRHTLFQRATSASLSSIIGLSFWFDVRSDIRVSIRLMHSLRSVMRSSSDYNDTEEKIDSANFTRTELDS